MPQPLSPAEARVLLDPDRLPGREAVRTALMHLAALGHLRAESTTRRSWGVTSATIRLHGTGRGVGGLPAHLRVLLDALALPADGSAGPAPTEVVHRLQKAFGYDYGRYVDPQLRSPLVERGLLRAEETRVAGLFRRVRHHPTAEGERLRTELQGGVRAAAALPALLERDPASTASAAVALGGALLLADELRPHFAALGEAVRAHQPAMAEALLSPLALAEEDERRERWMETLTLLAEIDWGGVLDALDGVADAFDAGDGGGADGGGGDGGGGGE